MDTSRLRNNNSIPVSRASRPISDCHIIWAMSSTKLIVFRKVQVVDTDFITKETRKETARMESCTIVDTVLEA